MTTIETKLGWDVFKLGAEAHIVIEQEICQTVCQTQPCLHICPAELYTLNAEDEIIVDYEGCLECGTCLIACPHDALTWNYPGGSSGVQYRFG